MRLRRKRHRVRAFRKHFSLKPVVDRTRKIRPGDILLFSTMRDEFVRLPFFLQYYRNLGVSHFLIVDNGSDDGSREYLTDQPDVSLWTTTASYKASRFGMDWINALLRRHGDGHWCLTVDPDEFASKGKNTPLTGCTLRGAVVATIVGGRVVHGEKALDALERVGA